jgi:WD40 repeat protein
MQQRLRFLIAAAGLYLLFAAPLAAQAPVAPPTEPILRVDPGMHTAVIRRIGADDKCTTIVTGSEDKTIRLWRVADRQLIKTLRPPIGPRVNEGKIYAVAMSPDGSWIAAGGWTITGAQHYLYVFQAGTGALVARYGPFSVLEHIAISADGRRIAVTHGGGQGVRVWERSDKSLSSWRLALWDANYGRGSFTTGAAFSNDGALYTVSTDGRLRRYDLRFSNQPIVSISTRGGRRPASVAVDPSGASVAIGYGDTAAVDIYDASSLAYRFSADTTGVTNGNFGAVAWSSDGQQLFAGGGYSKDKRSIFRVWDQGGRGTPKEIEGLLDAILHLMPCGDGVAFAAGDPAFGIITADGERWTKSSVGVDMRGKLGDSFTVSPDGLRIRLGLKEGIDEPVLFSLKDEQFINAPDALPGLERPKTDSLPVTDWMNSRVPRLAGETIQIDNQERSQSLAISPDNQQFALGADYYLRLYDRDGTLRWRQQAPGIVWGVNAPREKPLIVAAFGDGTIRWYKRDNDKSKELLSLFIHVPSRRWVAWTPSGYYMASPGAEDLIGWHVNRGWEQSADWFTVARFHKQFNRPDIVKLVLDTLDEDAAVRRANEDAKRQEKPSQIIVPAVIRLTGFFNEGGLYTFSSEALEIEYELRSPSGRTVESIEFLINGKAKERFALNPRSANPTQSRTGVLKVSELPKNDIEIALIAWTGEQASEQTKFRLTWAGPPEVVKPKPKLNALIIGVSEYSEKKLKLNFAAKDARDIADKLQEQKGKTYADVQIKLITADANNTNNATRESILDGLDWLEKQATKPGPEDVSIVYLAGHGATDAYGSYWFLPSNVDTTELRKTGVSQEEIERTLGRIKSYVLLLLDTCYSGRVLEQLGLKLGISPLINRVIDRGVIAYSSSYGTEESWEGGNLGNLNLKNGLFTMAILEGLFEYQDGRLKADQNNEGSVRPPDLDSYVGARVRKLSNGRQNPIMVRPSAVPNFRIIISRP